MQTITVIDYTDFQTLLANTSAPAKFILYSMEQAAVSIGLYMNSNKI